MANKIFTGPFIILLYFEEALLHIQIASFLNKEVRDLLSKSKANISMKVTTEKIYDIINIGK
ncbi:hypothetical protein CJ195_14580 [Bacillus sp. UMB0899]|nr:hypothetical protein CJ195_14580 [Bacillus sp. UMB0899]